MVKKRGLPEISFVRKSGWARYMREVNKCLHGFQKVISWLVRSMFKQVGVEVVDKNGVASREEILG